MVNVQDIGEEIVVIHYVASQKVDIPKKIFYVYHDSFVDESGIFKVGIKGSGTDGVVYLETVLYVSESEF
jgi:hypothetical protein